MDYVRALRQFSFPHVNSTLEFFRFNKGNNDVNKFIVNLKCNSSARLVDFSPKSAAYAYIGKLTKGVKRVFAPAPVPGYIRQFALVSGGGVATRADGEKVELVARSDLSMVSDDTSLTVSYEATSHSLLVVHYYRKGPFVKETVKVAQRQVPDLPKKPVSLRRSWRVRPTDVGTHAPIPSKNIADSAAHTAKAPPTEEQALTTFGLFFSKGGGDESDVIILRKGVLFNRALNVPITVRNTFEWARIWDETSRRRGYFYVKDSVVVFFPIIRGRATIEDFIVHALPGSNVALPSIELWCMRSRAFVHTSKGWCWYNNERLRQEVLKRRCFSSSFTVGFVMFLGFRSLRVVRYAGTNQLHIPSSLEERRYGWKPVDVYLPNVSRAVVVAGDRTKVGGEILASVANALNQEEVYSSVVSSITNRLVLRDQSALLSHLDTKLCDMFSQRDAMIREKPSHKCDVFLKPQEKEKLRELFPELSILFSDSVKSSHPFANAIRGCFNAVFSRRCGGVSFFDIGGSFTYHVKAGHVNCHVCNPILDVKDVKRRIGEILFLTTAGGESFMASDLLMEAASKSVSYCSMESERCAYRASAGFMVDVYDMSVGQVAEAMDKKGCLIFDLALMFPVELLYGNGEIYLEDLDTMVVRQGETLTYNVGMCGEVYEHSFTNVSGFFTNAYVRASSGNVYKLEYEGCRSGYHHFTVCRAQKSQDVEVTQRSIVPTFLGKSIVFLPIVDGTKVCFKSMVLDSDFVDRIYSYALNTIGTFENRTFEYAVGAVRSQKTHVITGSRVVHSKVEISPDDMWGLVVSIMAQAIKDRAKSIRSYNFIRASDGSLASLFSLLFHGLGDCFSTIVSSYVKSVMRDNFNVLETLISMPKSFIVKVPGSVMVSIHTSGLSDRLELQGAFSLSKETFARRLRSSRLRVFSRAIVEDSIKVMKNMKTEDGKPLPITENSVYAFIQGNLSNVHCTRAGLLGGSKATAASFAAKGVAGRMAGMKAFSGVSSFLAAGGLFVGEDLTQEERSSRLLGLEHAVNSPTGVLEVPKTIAKKVVSGSKTFLSELSAEDFCTFVLKNKVLIGVFTLSAALAPVAWKYRREVADKTRKLATRAYGGAGAVGLQCALQSSTIVRSTALGGAAIARGCSASAVAVTRATVAKRQVPLALLSFSTSYAISGYNFLGMWAHALPRHLMFFFGLGTLLGARASTRSWTFGGFSNQFFSTPQLTWEGRSYKSLLPQIALGASLVVRGLMRDSTPQLTYVPPIEGRNVYDQALSYYRDFDYDDGAGTSGANGDSVPEGNDLDASSDLSGGVSFTNDVDVTTRVETGREANAETSTQSSLEFKYSEEEVAPVTLGDMREELAAPTPEKETEEGIVVEGATDIAPPCVQEAVDQPRLEEVREAVVDVPQSNQREVEGVDDVAVTQVVEGTKEKNLREEEVEAPNVVPVKEVAVPRQQLKDVVNEQHSEALGPSISVVEATVVPKVSSAVGVVPKIPQLEKGKGVVKSDEPKVGTIVPQKQGGLAINEGKTGKELCMFRTCSCGVRLDVFNDALIAPKFSDSFQFVDNLKGRQAVFFSKLGEGYSYVGGSHSSAGWPRVLEDILKSIRFPSVFDHCLVQKYKQGGGVPFHADDEDCYPHDNPILTVNLVGKANFSVRCRRGGKVMTMNVASGDYFLMPCGFQRTHLHSVTAIDEGRISLTFRATRRVSGVGRSLFLIGGVQEVKDVEVPKNAEASLNAKREPVVKPQPKALSEGSARDVKKRTTYSIWCEQDYVKKCAWLRAENPVMDLKPDYTPMTFEVVKTGTTEDAVIEYMKYLAIGIERTYRALLMARNIAVVTQEGVLKVPNQVYESLPGFHVHKSSSDLIYHATIDGLRVRDLPYVFLADRGIFVKGKEVDVVASLGENLFVCDDIVVFHDAINLMGALKVARCGMVGESFKSFEYKCYNAPPGGGKTTMLVDEFIKAPNSTVMITANVGSSEDINSTIKKRDPNLEGVNSATTVNSRVVNFFVRGMFRRILVDEVYMMHQGLLQLGVFATGAQEGLFFGDINQIPFINREKVFRMDCAVFVPKKECVVYTQKSYRCPLDVCYLLSSMNSKGTEKCYPGKVISGRGEPVVRSLSKRPIGTTEDVAEIDADIYLCMTQLEKSEMKRSLKGKGKEAPVMTVHEAQGKTFENVVLFRTKKADDTLFTKQPHILVGLSRHTRSLVYAALSSKLDDKIGTYISDVSPQSVSDALLHTFAPSGCFRGL
uniref:Papain-like protease, methyl transferase, AlkB and helicase domains n=1 Tax=Grapevine leafroll-associated virus 3 TaxID=55951 RepID=A0A2R2Y3D9_9CLOS|nr:Papain-like protease, methyl transferase, AlkB and helicase domains [Grapevine leafroll-associated virus 3]